jgi:putative nucleotidyltransferase-like protein
LTRPASAGAAALEVAPGRVPDGVDHHAAMGRLAVDLLSGPATDRNRGAHLACRRGLANLFVRGVATLGSPDALLTDVALSALRRACRTEAYDDAVSAQEIGSILDTLAQRGLTPVVLKGRLLASRYWPDTASRPAYDLDLLLESGTIDEAIAALTASGYVEVPEPQAVELKGAILLPPVGRRIVVDLHWRPMRTAARGIDPVRLLSRARPAVLDGRPIRMLEEADQLLYLLVHHGKHGLRQLKWLLDLHAIARRAQPAIWGEAARRAIASRSTRPFSAAAAVVTSLPGVTVERDTLRSVQSARPVRWALSRIITRDAAAKEIPLSRTELIALEILLEESVRARLRRGWHKLQREVLDIPDFRA